MRTQHPPSRATCNAELPLVPHRFGTESNEALCEGHRPPQATGLDRCSEFLLRQGSEMKSSARRPPCPDPVTTRRPGNTVAASVPRSASIASPRRHRNVRLLKTGKNTGFRWILARRVGLGLGGSGAQLTRFATAALCGDKKGPRALFELSQQKSA